MAQPPVLPLFATSPTGHPTEFGRIFPPDKPWLARQPREEILFPDLPIVDPHHHLWDVPGFRYLIEEFTADTGTGHNVVATLHAECVAMYRADGPVHLRPVSETEFAAGVHAMSRSGRYGRTRVGLGIVGFAELRLGAAVDEVLEAHLRAAPDSAGYSGAGAPTTMWTPPIRRTREVSQTSGGRGSRSASRRSAQTCACCRPVHV